MSRESSFKKTRNRHRVDGVALSVDREDADLYGDNEMKNFKNERAFTRWFCKQLRAVNAETVAFVGSSMQRAGIPDRYVCRRDFRGWLEFKKDRGRVAPAQRIFMKRMTERGDTCLVVRFLSDAYSYVVENVDGETLVECPLNPLPDGKELIESLQVLF